MARILVVPVGKSDAPSAGVPEDLAGEQRAFLVVDMAGQAEGLEGTVRGDVVLLGEGQGWGVYRAGRAFELRRGGEGHAVARGDVIGVLKKFRT
ncbi:MAG: hypothetical protein JRG91_05170 [Deltaproteobacteria bacterium]|nr:hypothetical protein [Deltaproteobacteria bacterium]